MIFEKQDGRLPPFWNLEEVEKLELLPNNSPRRLCMSPLLLHRKFGLILQILPDPTHLIVLACHPFYGGGVAIIYRIDLKCHKVITLPSVKSFEYVCCRLTTSQRNDNRAINLPTGFRLVVRVGQCRQ